MSSQLERLAREFPVTPRGHVTRFAEGVITVFGDREEGKYAELRGDGDAIVISFLIEMPGGPPERFQQDRIACGLSDNDILIYVNDYLGR